jgi:hypothetical protein
VSIHKGIRPTKRRKNVRRRSLTFSFHAKICGLRGNKEEGIVENAQNSKKNKYISRERELKRERERERERVKNTVQERERESSGESSKGTERVSE